MSSSSRSNKESQLIFSPDPASLERTIRKEARSLSTDNNNSVSLDYAQQPSTQTPVMSTNSRSPLSIDIPSRTSIDTDLRAMGAAIPEPDATTTGTTLPVDEAAQPRTLADYNRPDPYYTNRSAILPPTIERDFELKAQYMPSSARSNKESQLLFSPDPAGFECTIRKEARSLSIDNNNHRRPRHQSHRPILAHPCRATTQSFRQPITFTRHRSTFHLGHRSILNREQWYMPSSTRSNKESQLIFSPYLASLERMIRKEARSLSTDNNNSVSLDSAQPPSTQTPVPSTQTPVPSTYSRLPLSIDNTDLPSTDNLHPTSIDIPSRTSSYTDPRSMVWPLILVRDNNGDLHDQEGHLRNAAGGSSA
ncbi:hypothetical protein F2Q70_00011985 [Brassica cretica]|uniref:Uncharacterized protein n=1 Tax=Brassica cretica TaxID=69181 RepID=A0A8S9M7Q8_BRACR|nr:hypothetical protein F2Q70_00011985 [Brassica cretica]